MRVLHVGECVAGGVATYIRELLEFQSNCNEIEEVYLLISDYRSEKSFNLKNENIYYYKFQRNLLYIYIAIFQIYKCIKRLEPDIVHIHSSFAGFLVRIIFFFIPKKKMKIVYCAHGWAFLMDVSNIKKKIYSFIELILSIPTDIIINISNYEHDNSVKFGIPPRKCIRIYNGLREASYIENLNTHINTQKDDIVLLFIGRFDRMKGLDILLETWRKIKLSNLKLCIIGDRVLGDLQYKLPADVIHLGWVDNKIIDNYYRLCDAVIIPSRGEGFGLVALEAMRNGKAVIASNRGALPEVVIKGNNGYIFNLQNQDELIDILSKLNKEKLKEMGLNGYHLFLENYSSRIFNESIIETYRALLMRGV